MPDSLSDVLRKLRGRTPRELLVRARQAGALIAERRGPVGRGASLDAFPAQLAAGVTPAFMNGAGRWVALAAWEDPAAIAHMSAALSPRVAAAVVVRAEAALEGRFSLLGYPNLEFGRPVDWHLDPVHERRSPRVHWSRVAYLDPEVVGDHKVVWELNRQQHLVTLAQAHLLTGEVRFATGAAAHLQSWMDHNPPKVGINWASSLEVSFRSIAWCWTLHLLRGHAALTEQIVSRALACLELNARHIESYLSTYFAPNTHLTGEGLGLFYIGCAFPELAGAARWRRTGWQILVEEFDRQVFPDGVYYEQSTYYQRYVLDFYVHAILLAERANVLVPAGLCGGVGRLARYLETIMRPDGRLPLIGDDDGGRLLPLSGAAGDDVRPALEAADSLTTGSLVHSRSDEAAFETLWLAAREPAATIQPPPPADSQAFPAGGVAVLRHGAGRDSNIMVLDAGPLGAARTNSVHSHADALAFDLVVLGRPMLVDPGTFTYVVAPTERNRFRSTGMHNTVTLGDGSSSVLRGAFGWALARHARLDSWAHGTDFSYVSASLQGYGRLGDQVVHRREVLFLHSVGWFMRDRVTGQPPSERVRLHFHAAPEVTIQTGSPGIAEFLRDDAGLMLHSAPCEAAVTYDDQVSPLYGALLPSRSVSLDVPSGDSVDVITALVPFRPETGAPRITHVAGAERSLRVRREHESWQVAFGDLQMPQGFESNAHAAWASSDDNGLSGIGRVLGSRLAHPEAPVLKSAEGRWLSASCRDGAWQILTGPTFPGAA